MTRKQFIRDRTGEGYVDVAIAILLIFTVVAGIFSMFPIYTTYQSLNATARQIAHVVEVSGQADDATISLVTGDGSYINPDSIVFDTTWYNASQKKIQLKTPFTVTITKQVLIPMDCRSDHHCASDVLQHPFVSLWYLYPHRFHRIS